MPDSTSGIAGGRYLEQTTIDLMLENILYQEVKVVIVEWASFWSGRKGGVLLFPIFRQKLYNFDIAKLN